MENCIAFSKRKEDQDPDNFFNSDLWDQDPVKTESDPDTGQ